MTPVQIGCAVLNVRSSLHSGGWASLAGGAPFKFTMLETLQQAGPLWVVSATESTFLTEGGANYPFLRHANFLPTSITSIAEEVSDSWQTVNSETVRRVSEILTRVLELADTMAPVSQALLDNSHDTRTLTAAMQVLMAPILRSDPMPEELAEAMPSLFKAQPPLGSQNGNDIAVRIPANRILLAESVLASGVPGSVWTEVSPSDYPSVLHWAIGNNKQIIAKVTIKGPLPGIKANLPLMGHLTRGAVRWMALPEIIALNKIVDMREERIFVAEERVPASASLKVPPPVFSPAATGSISAGLFAEAYLHAAASPALLGQAHAGEGANVAPKPVQTHSVRAAWLLSSARALMMQDALSLTFAGYSVIGFGPTHVLVSVSRRNLRDLRRAVASSKYLSYPTSLRSQEPKPLPVDEGLEATVAEGAR
jgi:hypothetical protein